MLILISHFFFSHSLRSLGDRKEDRAESDFQAHYSDPQSSWERVLPRGCWHYCFCVFLVVRLESIYLEDCAAVWCLALQLG